MFYFSKIASLGDIKKYIASLSLGKGSLYPCSVCKNSYPRKTTLRNHMFGHLADPMVKCPECSQMCRNRLRLWRHLYEVHKDETKRQVCHVCGDKFIFQRDLLNHKCPEEFKFMEKCALCDTILNSHKAVHQHMKWHKNADKSFICDICGQTLTTKGNLKLHKLAIHEGIKIKKKRIKHGPRFCELCGKTVSHDLFKTHMNIHNNIKPYKCKYCEKAFPSYLRLREHIRTHTGERPYVCTVCEKGFSQSHSLKTHMKSVHNLIKPKGQLSTTNVTAYKYDGITEIPNN